jgi:hypothetical protein
MKDRLTFNLIALAIFASITLAGWIGFAQKSDPPVKRKLTVSIKPQHLADALRAVIASDREVYTQLAARHAPEKGLPNPCEVFRQCSETAASKGVEFSYVLPIRQRNAPETDVETKGLQFVSTRPDQAHYTEEILGGRWYFTAVYPDVAVNQSCVTCHNQHQDSPKKDFKLGEVMGGVVVRVALEL